MRIRDIASAFRREGVFSLHQLEAMKQMFDADKLREMDISSEDIQKLIAGLNDLAAPSAAITTPQLDGTAATVGGQSTEVGNCLLM